MSDGSIERAGPPLLKLYRRNPAQLTLGELRVLGLFLGALTMRKEDGHRIMHGDELIAVPGRRMTRSQEARLREIVAEWVEAR